MQELQTSFPWPVSVRSVASGPAAEAEVPPRAATAVTAANRAVAFLMESMM